MIENWIDELTAVWTINYSSFGTVHSYNLVHDADFPESIDLNELKSHPIALTFIPTLEPEYSTSGPLIAYWRGETEIHLAPDFSKTRIPQMLLWYKLVLDAAAGHTKLNNKVELFMIPQEQDAITLTSLKYGEESPHWGMVVRWIVKERLEGTLTVSA